MKKGSRRKFILQSLSCISGVITISGCSSSKEATTTKRPADVRIANQDTQIHSFNFTLLRDGEIILQKSTTIQPSKEIVYENIISQPTQDKEEKDYTVKIDLDNGTTEKLEFNSLALHSIRITINSISDIEIDTVIR